MVLASRYIFVCILYLRCSDKPSVVTLFHDVNDVSLAELHLIFILRLVVVQGTVSKQENKRVSSQPFLLITREKRASRFPASILDYIRGQRLVKTRRLPTPTPPCPVLAPILCCPPAEGQEVFCKMLKHLSHSYANFLFANCMEVEYFR